MTTDNILVSQEHVGAGAIGVAVKDCIDIAGQPTRAGSACLDNAEAAIAHADVVAHVLGRGGRIVGKANMHEFAYGITGVNARFGTPANPRFPGVIPGGSSSGSAAAVAAGLARIAIGSDTGGSIRVPATCCGVFGMKPTIGRVSRKGCLPAYSTLDCIGPFADSLDDLELAMGMIDPTYVRASDCGTVRLGLLDVAADAPVALACLRYLEGTGAALTPMHLEGFEQAYRAGLDLMGAECWLSFGALAQDPRMGRDVSARLLAASAIAPAQVADAESLRASFTAAVDTALAHVDALALPTLPSVPPTLGGIDQDPGVVLNLTSLVRPFNLSGHPVISIPLRTAEGLPAGLQLVGGKGRDEALLAVARHLVRGGGA